MKEEDLKIEAWPPRKTGGQVVGIMSAGVRVTHVPTDMEATCTCERSQSKNKKVAISMLEWGLMEVGWRDES